MIRRKFYITESLTVLLVGIYMFFLYFYNKKLLFIWNSYSDWFHRSLAVMGAENYETYLLLGIVAIGVMIFEGFIYFKHGGEDWLLWLGILINLLLIICTFTLLCNPILAALSFFLVVFILGMEY